MKRSTATAVERMKAANIPCWIETHRRMNGAWQRELPRFQMKNGQRKRQNGTPALASNREDESNHFFKPEETEVTKFNDKTMTRRKIGKANVQLQQHIPKSLTGLRRRLLTKDQAYRRCPRSLPCLRSRTINKDQTDFDWQGIQAFYDELTMPAEQGMHQCVLGLSKKEKSQRADERKPLGHESLHFPKPLS